MDYVNDDLVATDAAVTAPAEPVCPPKPQKPTAPARDAHGTPAAYADALQEYNRALASYNEALRKWTEEVIAMDNLYFVQNERYQAKLARDEMRNGGSLSA